MHTLDAKNSFKISVYMWQTEYYIQNQEKKENNIDILITYLFKEV